MTHLARASKGSLNNVAMSYVKQVTSSGEEKIVFLYAAKIGRASRSYGLETARTAGIDPQSKYLFMPDNSLEPIDADDDQSFLKLHQKAMVWRKEQQRS